MMSGMSPLARRIAWTLIGMVVMGMALTTTSTLVLIRDDQKNGVERSKQTQENTRQIKQLAETIESCTNPKGECYKRGQARTGSAIASINEITIAAAACAKQPNVVTVREVRACVERTIAN